MKVFKVEIQVIDFDEIGEEGVRSAIENTKYPNYCINPQIRSIESRDIEWTDDHPLNRVDTEKEAYRKLFEES